MYVCANVYKENALHGHMLHNNHDYACLLHVCNYFILSYFTWALHSVLSPECAVLCFLVLCYYSFSCACVAHNALHTTTFRSKTLETLYHHVLTLSYGHPTATMVGSPGASPCECGTARARLCP